MSVPTLRWQCDAGLGDNLERLQRPDVRRMFQARREGRVKIRGYLFGQNQSVLAQLYRPMVDELVRIRGSEEYFALDLPSTESLPDEGEPAPMDFQFTEEEIALANRYVNTARGPRLMIQEVGGTHDGATQTRKCWGVDNYREIVIRWKQTFGEHTGIYEFGPKSSLGLPCFPNIRISLAVARQMDLLIVPESAGKYLSPLFGVGAVILWSQFHDYTPEEQWRIWYQPFGKTFEEYHERYAQAEPQVPYCILNYGQLSCQQTTVDEVWTQALHLTMGPYA